MLATPDQQISPSDPDARSMATSGRGSGMVGCTTGKERRITRWEHEHVLEAVQRRLDEHPEKMRQRRETVTTDHPNPQVRHTGKTASVFTQPGS